MGGGRIQQLASLYEGHLDTDTEEITRKQAEAGGRLPQAQGLHGFRATPEAQRDTGRLLPQSLQKALILPTAGFWTSGLHKCENKLLFFQAPRLWCFVRTALGGGWRE